MPNSWDPQNQFKNGKSHTHLGQPIGEPYRIPGDKESIVQWSPLFQIQLVRAYKCTPYHLQTTPHKSKAAMIGEAKEEEEEGRVPVALEPTNIPGRLLLGRHALWGRERDAAKDDLPAPGIWASHQLY